MTSNQVRYFLEVADRQNMTAAAEQLYLAQSTLSRQIQLLEEELGAQLFVRDKSGLTLTRAGEIFYNEAREIYAREQRLRARIESAAHGRPEMLRLSMLEETFPPDALVRAVQNLRAVHPAIDVTIKVLDVHNLFMEFGSGGADAVCTLRHNVDIIDDAVCIPLATEPMFLACSSTIPLPDSPELTTDDLERLMAQTDFLMVEPSVFDRQNERLRGLLYTNMQDEQVSRIRYLRSTASIAMHVLCGLGVTMVHASHRLTTAPGIRLKPVRGAVPVELVCAYRAGSSNPALPHLVEQLQKQLT